MSTIADNRFLTVDYGDFFQLWYPVNRSTIVVVVVGLTLHAIQYDINDVNFACTTTTTANIYLRVIYVVAFIKVEESFFRVAGKINVDSKSYS